MNPIFHPQPRFKLCHVKNLFRINYPFLEYNTIFLFPDTPHYGCPKTFPHQVSLATHLSQMKILIWHFKSLCFTNKMPIHLKHKDQTLCAYMHSKNKCWLESSLAWHIGHMGVFTDTPLLLKAIPVWILSSKTLQAAINTLGSAFTFHKHLKRSLWGPLTRLAKWTYTELIENNLDSSILHTWRSFTSLFKLVRDMYLRRSSSMRDSHSNMAHLHLKLHHHFDSSHTTTSPTFSPWFRDKEYKLRNTVLRFRLPTHTSSQNLTLSLAPIFQPIAS